MTRTTIIAHDPHLPEGMEVETDEERAKDLLKSGLYKRPGKPKKQKKSKSKSKSAVTEASADGNAEAS